MTDIKRGPFGYIAHVLAQILVGIWVIVDSILSPIFRPLMRWLSESASRPGGRELGSRRFPPYAILVLLALPFGIEEVAKIYAFVLMGGGHFKIGFALYIACHVFAILVCERIFHAGKAKLMTIDWFARLFNWLMGYKERLVDWFKSTSTYRRAMELKAQGRQMARLALRRTKTALGR